MSQVLGSGYAYIYISYACRTHSNGSNPLHGSFAQEFALLLLSDRRESNPLRIADSLLQSCSFALDCPCGALRRRGPTVRREFAPTCARGSHKACLARLNSVIVPRHRATSSCHVIVPRHRATGLRLAVLKRVRRAMSRRQSAGKRGLGAPCAQLLSGLKSCDTLAERRHDWLMR